MVYESKTEQYLASIADSLKRIADSTPSRAERLVEQVYAAILVNTAQQETPNRALELANALDDFMRNITLVGCNQR